MSPDFPALNTTVRFSGITAINLIEPKVTRYIKTARRRAPPPIAASNIIDMPTLSIFPRKQARLSVRNYGAALLRWGLMAVKVIGGRRGARASRVSGGDGDDEMQGRQNAGHHVIGRTLLKSAPPRH